MKALQRLLVKAGYSVPVDGLFGEGTLKVVNDLSNKTNPPPTKTQAPFPLSLILSPTRMRPFYTPQKPQHHIPHPNRAPANNESP